MSGPLYSLLKDISLELMRHRQLQDLLPDIVRRAQEFVGADLAYMALRDEFEEVMRVAFYRGTIRELPEDYTILRGEGISGQAWATGQIVVTEDYNQYSFRLPAPYWGEMRETLAVPLYVKNSVWGVLILAHTGKDKKYSAAEIEGLEQLATFASIAIENAKIIDSGMEPGP
jgi:GAF domain-containing protein